MPEEWTETIPAATVLLEQLQEMPPGPELAALLASADRSNLDSAGLLLVAQARQRLIAHQEAEFLSDLHAIARTVPDQGSQPGRRDPGKYPWAEVEAACALRWSYHRAGAHLVLADEVIDRLPSVHAALAAGHIDMPTVHLMTELVSGLDDEPARRVIDKVIDTAPRQTAAELRARLRRPRLPTISPHVRHRPHPRLSMPRLQRRLRSCLPARATPPTCSAHKWIAYDRLTGEVLGRGGLSRTSIGDDWGQIRVVTVSDSHALRLAHRAR